MWMKFSRSWVSVAGLALLPFAAAGAPKTAVCFGPGKSAIDVPLRLTFHDTAIVSNWDGTATGTTVPSAIVGDSAGDVYTDSTSDAYVAIQCQNGTYDAYLQLNTGRRSYTWIVPPLLPPTPYIGPNGNTWWPNAYTLQPGRYTAEGVFNIRNILCYGCANYTPGKPFVTSATADFYSIKGITTDHYSFRFLPLANPTSLPAAPDLDNDGPGSPPLPDSWVLVLPQPYNCAQGIYPSWVVRGTLFNTNTNGSSFLQAAVLLDTNQSLWVGEYSMPFEVQIQALQCFNPGY
jgi:hypothetical protein